MVSSHVSQEMTGITLQEERARQLSQLIENRFNKKHHDFISLSIANSTGNRIECVTD